MNLLATAPDWLAAIFLFLLVIAAAEDGWRMQISNLTSGAIAIGAFVAVALDGPIVGLWENVVLFVAMLVVGTFMFGRGWMGGGDVKLLAMIGAVLGWVAIPATVLIASLTGSAVGIPAILIRGRHLRPRAGMRVGAAVVAVTAVVLWIVEWRVSPVQAFRPPGLLPLALGLGVGALAGLLVTVRIAARRYPIPFGPFLALGALLCLFLDPQTFAWLMPWT